MIDLVTVVLVEWPPRGGIGTDVTRLLRILSDRFLFAWHYTDEAGKRLTGCEGYGEWFYQVHLRLDLAWFRRVWPDKNFSLTRNSVVELP